MIRLRHKILINLLRFYDQFLMAATTFFIIYIRPERLLYSVNENVFPDVALNIEDAFGMMLLAGGWIGIFDYYVSYNADRLIAISSQIYCVLKSVGLASFWLMIVCVVFSIQSFNIFNILIFFTLVNILCIVSRLILRLLLLTARRSGYNYRNLLVVGTNKRALDLTEKICGKPELAYKIIGFVSESGESELTQFSTTSGKKKILGDLKDIRCILSNEQVDEIVVCLPKEVGFGDTIWVIQHARDLGIVVRVIPDLDDVSLMRNIHVDLFENEYVVTLFRERLIVQLLIKRLIDATLSLLLLVILLPIFGVVSIMIKLTSPGPVFFVQNRVGMNQRQFKMYKFRSMFIDAEMKKISLVHLNERDGPVFKINNDPRITWVGKILRKSSIDELPQLFNVLCGEMSLVGPRPPLAEEVMKYDWLYRKRLSVKPGITCIWQISGRNNISFHRWMQMDHEYVENWSLLLDLEILIKTLPAVLLSKGAS